MLDICKCIRCGHDFVELNTFECPDCGLPKLESQKYYEKLNNQKLAKMHPNKRLSINHLSYCPRCNCPAIVDTEAKTFQLGCTWCLEGEVFSIPINEKFYDFPPEIITAYNRVFKDAFIRYPDDRKIISRTTDGLPIYSEQSENFSKRNQYIIDNVKLISKNPPKPAIQLRSSVSCPYCSSSNTSKIGFLSRSLSIGLFGLSSSKIGKQWHCNNCSSNF